MNASRRLSIKRIAECVTNPRVSLFIRGFTFLFVTTQPIFAQQTLDDLFAEDRLKVTTTLSPAEGIIATQKVVLNIDIATDSWIAGGTRVGTIEVPGAIVLQRQRFGQNSSSRINGRTWATQRWKVEIYPRDSGAYTIPSFDIELTISGGQTMPIRGTVSTGPIAFLVTSPKDAPASDSWVAAESLSITESWDKELDELEVGNARIRTVTIEADGLPAMMLPSSGALAIDGVATYPQPAKVSDYTGRGQSRGIRTETLSFFFEQPGAFIVPEQRIDWWNTKTGSWEVAFVEARTVNIAQGSALASSVSSNTELQDENHVRKTVLIVLIIIAGFGLLAYGALIFPRKSKWSSAKEPSAASIERERWKKLKRSLGAQQVLAIVDALYSWQSSTRRFRESPTLNSLAREVEDERLPMLLDELLGSAYSESPKAFGHSAELLKVLRSTRRKILKKRLKKTSHSTRISTDLSALN